MKAFILEPTQGFPFIQTGPLFEFDAAPGCSFSNGTSCLPSSYTNGTINTTTVWEAAPTAAACATVENCVYMPAGSDRQIGLLFRIFCALYLWGCLEIEARQMVRIGMASWASDFWNCECDIVELKNAKIDGSTHTLCGGVDCNQGLS